MDHFKKILVPLDGSEHSKRSLETAITLAKKFEGNITLIHVYSTSILMPISMYDEEFDVAASTEVSKLLEMIREAGAEILATGRKRCEVEGIPLKTLLEEGHAVQEIIKTAREGGFHLIVMGAKGRSKIKEILLGSVSEKVVRNASCAVMVVK